MTKPGVKTTFAALLTLSLGAASCRSTPAPSSGPVEGTPLPVAAGRVSVTTSPAVFEAGGVLVASQSAIISSRVMAPIARITVDAGDRVRRGQVLVALDGDEVQAQAEGARANLESARAEGRVAASDRAMADAGLTLARATHGRIVRLHAERSATTQELDEAAAALKQAEARVALAAAQADVTERTVEAATAGVRAAEVAQTWSTLVAPFDGVVAARHADPGTMAAPGVPLLTIEASGALQLDVQVDASRAAGLVVGQSADIRVDDAGTSEWFAGRIAKTARVDAASHSLLVTVTADANASWRSGLFGRARFRGPAAERLTVPAESVVKRGQLALVFVIGTDEHVRLRMVSLGETFGDRTEVLAGLAAGDRVVLRPAAALSDGAVVRVTNAGELAGGPR